MKRSNTEEDLRDQETKRLKSLEQQWNILENASFELREMFVLRLGNTNNVDSLCRVNKHFNAWCKLRVWQLLMKRANLVPGVLPINKRTFMILAAMKVLKAETFFLLSGNGVEINFIYKGRKWIGLDMGWETLDAFNRVMTLIRNSLPPEHTVVRAGGIWGIVVDARFEGLFDLLGFERRRVTEFSFHKVMLSSFAALWDNGYRWSINFNSKGQVYGEKEEDLTVMEYQGAEIH